MIANEFDGDIFVESEYNVGSKFIFFFKLSTTEDE